MCIWSKNIRRISQHEGLVVTSITSSKYAQTKIVIKGLGHNHKYQEMRQRMIKRVH